MTLTVPPYHDHHDQERTQPDDQVVVFIDEMTKT